ncbi:MAG: general secretion pathway protein GspK [Burkholderiales bacterium]|nr:general secretion pathway protein GspK [Burkholderiales bacterium]
MSGGYTCRRQRGFVLALTLWVLAAIAIAAAYFADRTHRAIVLAQRSQDNSETLRAMSDSRAEMLYRLATTQLTPYGLGPDMERAVRLDNTRYRAEGQTWLQVQDDLGLINVNRAGDERLTRLLDQYGVGPSDAQPLLDKLHDYIEPGELRRLNGAKTVDYTAAGMPPPTHLPLLTPYQLSAVLGWSDLPFVRDAQFTNLLTTSGVGLLNPNMAPPEVLMTIPGMTKQSAQALIERRQLGPITDVDLVARYAGVPIDTLMFQLQFFPSNSLQITQGGKGLAWALRYNVTFTPTDPDRPWHIDYAFRLPNAKPPNSNDNQDPFASLPALPAIVEPAPAVD